MATGQSQQPTIVKYVQSCRTSIQAQNFMRHSVGYVLRGKKYIYYGDVRYEINRGDLFCLGVGTYYMEDMPEADKNFEQIVFYYTPHQLTQVLNHLSMGYRLNITNEECCENCRSMNHVVNQASSTMRNFFMSTNQYLKDDMFDYNETAESIKITELFYLILTQGSCCLKNKVLGDIDEAKESFEQIVYNHIFDDISIGELADKCNRSLTSFKKEFKRYFFDPPHKWFIRQRLMHSRLLLISTTKSITEIGIECNFLNTSHFIKLFKKEYGTTPASYRHNYDDENEAELNIAEVSQGA